MPPKPSSASCCSSQTVKPRPCSSAIAWACSASQAGFFTLEGTVASIRERQPAPPTAIARARTGPRSSGRSARTTRATGRCSGGPERQWNPNEPSIVPTTNGVERLVGRDRRDRGRDRAPVAGRPGQGGAGATEVLRAAASPTPISRTLRELGVVGGAERHRHGRDLAGAPGGRGRPRARRAGRGRAGLRGRRRPVPADGSAAVLAREDRQRHHLRPDHGVRAAPRSARTREVRPGSEVSGLRVPTRRQPTTSLRAFAESAGLLGVELDNEAATAFERDAHHDAASLLGDLQRTVARPRLHRRHPRTFLRLFRARRASERARCAIARTIIPYGAVTWGTGRGLWARRAAGRLGPCRPARHSSTSTATTCAPAAARRRWRPSSGCSTRSGSRRPPCGRRSRGWSCRAGSSRSSSAADAATAPPSGPTAASTRPATGSTGGDRTDVGRPLAPGLRRRRPAPAPRGPGCAPT